MKKPFSEIMRELWELGFAVVVFLVFMSLLWVYLLLDMFSAAYAEIVGRRNK